MSPARALGCLALVLLAPLVPLDARGDRSGELALAAARGDLKRVEALVAAGVDVNARRPGESPALLLAVRSGNAEVVQQLLRAGADPRAASASGASALVEAVAQGQPELARMLVEAGADVTVRHREHGTPLDAAERRGDRALAAFLRSHAAQGSGKSVGELVCVRLWRGSGYCAAVTGREGASFELRVLRVEGCANGCAADDACSAGRVVGGTGAHALRPNDVLVVPGSCLTHTGLGSAE